MTGMRNGKYRSNLLECTKIANKVVGVEGILLICRGRTMGTLNADAAFIFIACIMHEREMYAELFAEKLFMDE